MFCGFLDGIPTLVIVSWLSMHLHVHQNINDPCVWYEGYWDSPLDYKLSTSFFFFVDVVSIFL